MTSGGGGGGGGEGGWGLIISWGDSWGRGVGGGGGGVGCGGGDMWAWAGGLVGCWSFVGFGWLTPLRPSGMEPRPRRRSDERTSMSTLAYPSRDFPVRRPWPSMSPRVGARARAEDCTRCLAAPEGGFDPNVVVSIEQCGADLTEEESLCRIEALAQSRGGVTSEPYAAELGHARFVGCDAGRTRTSRPFRPTSSTSPDRIARAPRAGSSSWVGRSARPSAEQDCGLIRRFSGQSACGRGHRRLSRPREPGRMTMESRRLAWCRDRRWPVRQHNEDSARSLGPSSSSRTAWADMPPARWRQARRRRPDGTRRAAVLQARDIVEQLGEANRRILESGRPPSREPE